ncbi:MAG: HEAT repeat domain-containing protein [Cyanobacteria bacterium P01_A01_bin.84]
MNEIQKLIYAVKEADSANKLLDAVEELAAAKSQLAVPVLIAALSYNNPGAAVAAVDGLIAIGKASVKPLLELIDAHNYTARAWAIRALAGIGDFRGLKTLLDAAENDFALSVRRAAARGLGTLIWDEMTPETLNLAQVEVLEVLIRVCQDPEWVVRYAAINGLENVAQSTKHIPLDLLLKINKFLIKRLETEETIVVLTRIQLARQRVEQIISRKILLSESLKEEQQKPHRGIGRR